jgi:hypothetical protein
VSTHRKFAHYNQAAQFTRFYTVDEGWLIFVRGKAEVICNGILQPIFAVLRITQESSTKLTGGHKMVHNNAVGLFFELNVGTCDLP